MFKEEIKSDTEIKLNRSKERLKNLLEENAPDILIANECRIFLDRYSSLKENQNESDIKD